MGLIGADTLLGKIENSRSIWIYGHQGMYKTALAYMLAYELVKHRGYKYLISNVVDIWSNQPDEVPSRIVNDGRDDYEVLDLVAILDEGGKYIKTRAMGEAVMGFARKQNIVWLLPSEDQPTTNLTKVRVQLLSSLQVIGLPLLIFKWEHKNGSIKDEGKFYWWKPNQIYGVYNTIAGVQSDGGIVDWIEEKRKSIIKVNKKSVKLIDPNLVGYLQTDNQEQKSQTLS